METKLGTCINCINYLQRKECVVIDCDDCICDDCYCFLPHKIRERLKFKNKNENHAYVGEKLSDENNK